jgi:tRNA A37 methylthiotransferase MiaB
MSPPPRTFRIRVLGCRVNHAERRARVRELIALESGGDGLSVAYRKRLIGRQVRVIPEQVDPDRPGHWQGRCDQYALISVPGPLKRERIVRAIPRSINDDVILAQEIPATVPLPVL